MSTRPFRAAAALLATGALALTGLVGIASAASADEVVTYSSGAVITVLPAKANLVGNQNPAQFVKVQVAVPAGYTCPADFTARVVGQKNAVTLVSAVPDCALRAGYATWTVNANAITFKRNAVVKFVSTNPADGSKMVGTLVVKVNKGAAPAKPDKGHGNS
jgi:hypothetical protein